MAVKKSYTLNGKSYTLDMGGTFNGYKSDNWFGVAAGREVWVEQAVNFLFQNGKKPTKDELSAYLKRGSMSDKQYNNVIRDVDSFLSRNGMTYNDFINEYNTEHGIDPNEDSVTSNSYLEGMQQNAYQNYAGLLVDPNSQQGLQFKQDMYNSIDREESEMSAMLNQAELNAYKYIGQQQQQLENQIAEQRLNALKSGTTSAQLASQSLSNLFAAQSGAAQIAEQVLGERTSLAQTYAQQRGQVVPSLYDQINSNRQVLATSGAQNLASTSSYLATLQQQAASLNATNDFIKKWGYPDYKQVLGED